MKSISECNRAIELNPKDGNAYWCRGSEYSKSGQYDKAIEDLTKAIELGPSDITYHSRGCAYGMADKYNAALSDFETALRLNPNNSEVREKVNTLKEMGYKAESEADVKAKAAADARAEALANAARAAAEQNEKEAFRQSYNKTNGKNISLQDVVKYGGEWAYDGDVEVAKAKAAAAEKAKAEAVEEANAARIERNTLIRWGIVGIVIVMIIIKCTTG
jgi:tetratricopeptide (TPR) repeat protein